MREMKHQMERLAACRHDARHVDSVRDVTIKPKPIEHFEAWLHTTGSSARCGRGVWNCRTGSLKRCFPMLCRSIPAPFTGCKNRRSRSTSTHGWRIGCAGCGKPDGVKLSWGNLRQQFGQEYACSKDFKKEFRAALLKVRAVYPAARIDEEIGGLRLYSSPAPVPKSQVVVQLPAGK